MKKLIAAAFTEHQYLEPLEHPLFSQQMMTKPLQQQHPRHHIPRSLKQQNRFLRKGYDLEVTVFDDYVQPNEVVESGDFDANYFSTFHI